MTFEPGDLVERRQPMGEHRVGRIQGETAEGSNVWYVTVRETALTYIAQGRDLRIVKRATGQAE